MSFTRASSGWYFNSSGVLVSASSDVARFDYDPVTLQPLGYLAEMQSTNAVTQSSALTLANYTASAGIASATDGTVGPDGTTQMYKITSSAGAGYHALQGSLGTSYAAGTSLSFSAFVRQGNQRYATIADFNDAVGHAATFDFQTGAWLGSSGATTETPRQLANGLWRLGIKYTNTNAAYNVGTSVSFGPNATFGGAQNYTAAGTETGYATGLQSEAGGVGVTSYIPTAGSAVTRAADLLTLPLTSLPGWNASKGGVLVATYRMHTLVSGFNQATLYLGDTTFSNFIALYGFRNATNSGALMQSGSVSQADLSTSDSSPFFTRHKQAFGWSASHAAYAIDGLPVNASNGSYALPVNPSVLRPGWYPNAATNGTIESIAYYAGARSDAFVQQVSR